MKEFSFRKFLHKIFLDQSLSITIELFSFFAALEAIYGIHFPSHSSLPIARRPVGFWESTPNVLHLLEHIAVKLNVKTWTDWYHVSSLQLHAVRAYDAIKKKGGLITVLKQCYPQYPKQLSTLCPSVHFLNISGNLENS